MTKENRKCETCFYCEKYEVPNYERELVSNALYKGLLPETVTFHKCHIQGKPEKVHPESDWCYQWKLNTGD
jgi:hypothetical protein